MSAVDVVVPETGQTAVAVRIEILTPSIHELVRQDDPDYAAAIQMLQKLGVSPYIAYFRGRAFIAKELGGSESVLGVLLVVNNARLYVQQLNLRKVNAHLEDRVFVGVSPERDVSGRLIKCALADEENRYVHLGRSSPTGDWERAMKEQGLHKLAFSRIYARSIKDLWLRHFRVWRQLAKRRPFEIRSVVIKDVEAIGAAEVAEFQGDTGVVSPKMLLEWAKKCQIPGTPGRCPWAVLAQEKNGEHLGEFGVWPITPGAFDRLADGEIEESALTPADFLSYEDVVAGGHPDHNTGATHWYIGSINVYEDSFVQKSVCEALLFNGLLEWMLQLEDLNYHLTLDVVAIAFSDQGLLLLQDADNQGKFTPKSHKPVFRSQVTVIPGGLGAYLTRVRPGQHQDDVRRNLEGVDHRLCRKYSSVQYTTRYHRAMQQYGIQLGHAPNWRDCVLRMFRIVRPLLPLSLIVSVISLIVAGVGIWGPQFKHSMEQKHFGTEKCANYFLLVIEKGKGNGLVSETLSSEDYKAARRDLDRELRSSLSGGGTAQIGDFLVFRFAPKAPDELPSAAVQEWVAATSATLEQAPRGRAVEAKKDQMELYSFVSKLPPDEVLIISKVNQPRRVVFCSEAIFKEGYFRKTWGWRDFFSDWWK